MRAILIGYLTAALDKPGDAARHVMQFQAAVFDGSPKTLGLEDYEWDVMMELALDLDYYESDPALRREDASFFGNARMAVLIRRALERPRPLLGTGV